MLQAVTRRRNLPFYPTLAKAARHHHSIHSAKRCVGHCLGIDPLDRHLTTVRPGGCFECLGDREIGIGIINIFRDEANRQPLAVGLAIVPGELLPARHIRYRHIASKARQHRAQFARHHQGYFVDRIDIWHHNDPLWSHPTGNSNLIRHATRRRDATLSANCHHIGHNTKAAQVSHSILGWLGLVLLAGCKKRHIHHMDEETVLAPHLEGEFADRLNEA